jgi:hypothetical protein
MKVGSIFFLSIKSNQSMKPGIICFLLLLLSTQAIDAQSNDFGIWTSAGADKKLGKFTLSGETELRTKENSSEIDRWSIGLTADYQVFKPIKFGLGYDFIYFNDSKYSDLQPRHRANVFITGRQKVGNFCISIRERFQLSAKDVSDRIKSNGTIDNYKVNPEYIWRNKLKIEYTIPKFPITPSISAESFYTLNNPEGNGFEQIRFILGLNYKISKHHIVELYGLNDKEINSEDPIQDFVLGIGYQFHF